MDRIAVATSIPPQLSRRDTGHAIDFQYQALCIQSWLDYGFDVLSVNVCDEIPQLTLQFPEVTFVTVD